MRKYLKIHLSVLFALCLCNLVWIVTEFPMAQAQETDIFQHPNIEQAGIKKTLDEQVGTGRGDIQTPGSSLYIIHRDPFRSIRRGRNLFQRKFTISQGMGPRNGDGLGDISADASLGAGLADSCAACHGRPRGSAGFGGDVFTRPDSRDAPHLFGLGIIEMLADEITQDLRQIRDQAIALAKNGQKSVEVSLKSKGISYGNIRVNPEGSVDPFELNGVDEDLRVRPFFSHGGTISIREFIVGALNGEMGLEAFDPDLVKASSGERIVTPSGMILDGAIDNIEAPPASSESEDQDLDGIANEIPESLVDHMEFYLLNYFKPGKGRETKDSEKGEKLFLELQCSECHIQNLVIDHDRRVADVETTYDSRKGIFNHLFAMATPLFQEVTDSGSFPSLKRPNGKQFLVKNIFADFKRHNLGPNFWERNYDGTLTKEFMTEPLWGVGSTAPYGHDGRSIDLWSVIMRHGGEAQKAREQFAHLPEVKQGQILDFLQTLVLFPPDDTASNLNPGDPAAPNFPQYGHGNIALPVLFNDPTDLE